MKAIETTGILNKRGIIKLDEQVNLKKDKKVKVIILLEDENEIEEKEWLQSINKNPVFDFLKDEREDIYTVKDGKTFYGKK
jgi:hypothetical protein